MDTNDFIPYQQWPEFHLTENVEPFFKPEKVGTKPIGVRWGWWPLCFEEYISDIEPDLEASRTGAIARNRLVVWKRVARTDIPPGWHILSRRPSQVEGITLLPKEKEFYKDWSESARRYRKKWYENFLAKTHSIELLSFEEFKKGYMHSLVHRRIGPFLLQMLERKLQAEHEQKNIEMWGVKRLRDNVVVAGLAVVNSPTYKSSYYLCGFISSDAQDDPVMIGLMDHWFTLSQKRGFSFLSLGNFWQPGDPKEWKGFSLFKSKLGVSLITYKPSLIRFVRGKLF